MKTLLLTIFALSAIILFSGYQSADATHMCFGKPCIPNPALPGPPTDVIVEIDGEDVIISWTAPVMDLTIQKPIRNYVIMWMEVGTTSPAYAISSNFDATTITLWVDDDIDISKNWVFEIATINKIGGESEHVSIPVLLYPLTTPEIIIEPVTDPEPIIVPVEEPITKETPVRSKSGGGCADCTPPTLGKDSKGNLKVKDGIAINGHAEDGGYFHTDYPMQFTTLGKINNVTLKYYENSGPQNIKVVQLGIGVKEIGTPVSESQALIEVWIDNFSNDIDNPLIKEIRVIDPDNIISNEFASVYLVTCSDSMGMNNVKLSDSFEDKKSFYKNLVDSTCLSVSFGYAYDKVPESWILSSNAIDYHRNTINNYFNDGLTVIDPNPIQEVIKEPYEYECKDKTQNVMKKSNCRFGLIVESEKQRALDTFASMYGDLK